MRQLPAVLLALAVSACGPEDPARDPDRVPVAGRPGASKTTASLRAERRAFDGAPPVIPHASFGADCTSCHNERGMDVDEVGFAPPTPHGDTHGMSDGSRCTQCHVFQTTETLFVASLFEGRPQDLRRGARQHDSAPPVVPHGVFMRENCLACHDGPAAREELRTTHPERENCRQCHPIQVATGSFSR